MAGINILITLDGKKVVVDSEECYWVSDYYFHPTKCAGETTPREVDVDIYSEFFSTKELAIQNYLHDMMKHLYAHPEISGSSAFRRRVEKYKHTQAGHEMLELIDSVSKKLAEVDDEIEKFKDKINPV